MTSATNERLTKADESIAQSRMLLSKMARMIGHETKSEYNIEEYRRVVEAALDLFADLRQQLESIRETVGMAHRHFKLMQDHVNVLENALKGLLQDTQHNEHTCDDPNCPVKLAREALGAKAPPH